MRAYWDERARLNAAWFVDTSLAFDEPDMQRFFEAGREIAKVALEGSPKLPARRETALEIGPGLGRICLALLDHFEFAVGIDVSEEMVRRGRELITDRRVVLVVGDGSSLNAVKDASVDLVVTFTVFQHIPDRAVIERYVHEAGRVLRSGGLFVFQWNSTPGPLRWRLRRSVLAVAARLGVKSDRYGRHAPEFLGSRVPVRDMERAVEAAGMRMLKVQSPGQLFTFGWAERTT